MIYPFRCFLNDNKKWLNSKNDYTSYFSLWRDKQVNEIVGVSRRLSWMQSDTWLLFHLPTVSLAHRRSEFDTEGWIRFFQEKKNHKRNSSQNKRWRHILTKAQLCWIALKWEYMEVEFNHRFLQGRGKTGNEQELLLSNLKV